MTIQLIYELIQLLVKSNSHFNLLGPSGNVITSNKFNANPTGVDNIIDTLRDTVCSQILVSLMKFKKDF